MAITLYTHKIHDEDRSPNNTIMDKDERQKEIQNAYYKRRGFFMAYKRRIAKKLGYTHLHLKHISNIDELELFCKAEIIERGHIISEGVKPCIYVLNIL
jgi:hypothetical protein